MFDRKDLDKIFERLRKSENPSTDAHYVVADADGKYVGQVVFVGEELNIEVDGFPNQKEFYSTNLPIKSNAQFATELERAGLQVL